MPENKRAASPAVNNREDDLRKYALAMAIEAKRHGTDGLAVTDLAAKYLTFLRGDGAK